MSTQAKTFLTPEQYLEIERRAEYKSEYYQGEMFAMSGVTYRHSLIVSNIHFQLRLQLQGRPCDAHTTDLRVRVSATGLYTYPDVVVVCGEPQFEDDELDTLLNPLAIVEVLSPSTEAYDRGRKFDHYRAIASLKQYLLVAFDRIHVDLYTRGDDGQWVLTAADGPEESIELAGCRFKLSDIYERVELASTPPTPPAAAE